MLGDAKFSPDGLYRWWLSREWIGGTGTMAIVGLNPSKAGPVETDPTITREVGFGQSWGFAKLLKLNAYGLVSTDPRGLREVADPVGSENERTFWELLPGCDLVVCAWGVHATYLDQGRRALEWIRAAAHQPMVLRLTKGGHPQHPLYLPKHLKPIPWEGYD